MLAKLIALYLAVTVFHDMGRYLFRVAWHQGGLARVLAVVVAVVLCTMAAWLLMPDEPDAPPQQRLSEFIGAFGIVLMVVGIVAGVAALLGKLRDGKDGRA